MNKYLTFFCTGVLFIFLAASCKKPVPPQAKFIPKNASFVGSVNVSSLVKKMAKSQSSLENIIKNMTADNDTALEKGKKEWADFQNSGIETDDNIYMWVVQKGGANLREMQPGNALTSVTGRLDDAGKFEAYVKMKVPGAEIKKEKLYSYATKDNNSMIAWDKDEVVVMSYQNMGGDQMEYDSVTGTFNRKAPASDDHLNDLKTEMNKSFEQKESSSVASIAEFRDLAQEKADAFMWINSAATVDNIPVPLPKIKELLENNYTAATMNFEDGKMVFDSKSYTGNALKDILKKHAGPEADLSLVEKFPSNNINGFMVFAFDPQIFTSIVKFMEVGALADGFLTKFMGSTYTLADALKAIKGDVAVVVSDVGMKQGDTSMMPGMRAYSVPKARLIFTMTVGDKTQMNKLMERLVSIEMLEKTNGLYKPRGVPSTFGLTALVDDKRLTIASDQDILNAYKSNGKAVLKSGVMDDFKGKAAVAYLDIESILNALSNDKTNIATADEVMPFAKETFKDARAYANNFKDNYTSGHFELRFKNEKENSLVSLLNFMSKASDAARKNNQGMSTDKPFNLNGDMDEAK